MAGCAENYRLSENQKGQLYDLIVKTLGKAVVYAHKEYFENLKGENLIYPNGYCQEKMETALLNFLKVTIDCIIDDFNSVEKNDLWENWALHEYDPYHPDKKYGPYSELIDRFMADVIKIIQNEYR